MPFTTTVITGATSGIGRETAMALAGKGHAIYMLVRDTAKGERVKQEIISTTKNKNISVVACDLADLKSVRNAAESLKGSLTAINVLINNAGGIFSGYQESRQGYEMTFAVNHLGHFLLVQHLLPLLEKGQARIINISSEAHRMGKPRLDDLQWKKRAFSAFAAYGAAKLFNIYFTRSLTAKYGDRGISAFALHPGLVKTGFGEQLTGMGQILIWLAKPFMITAREGAQTIIYLATAPKMDAQSGKYFKKKKVSKPSATAEDDSARGRLWAKSLEMTAAFSS